MARTVQQIQADIDTVRSEMSNSAQEARFGDRMFRSRSTDEALKALAALEIELNSASAAANNTTRPRQVRLSGSSGFGSGGCA